MIGVWNANLDIIPKSKMWLIIGDDEIILINGFTCQNFCYLFLLYNFVYSMPRKVI